MPASLHDVLAEIAIPANDLPAAREPYVPPPLQPANQRSGEAPAEVLEPAFGARSPRPEEIEARIAQARDEAVAEAMAEAQARFAAALDEARAEAVAAHEAALAEARAGWAATEGARLADLVAEGLGAIEERVSEATARALAPLLSRAAREEALRELAEAIRALLRADPALPLVMRGPTDLGEALLARLGDSASAVRWQPAETPDLVVEGGDTLIETRLAAWAERVHADAA